MSRHPHPARAARRNQLFLLGVLPSLMVLALAAQLVLLVRGNAEGRAAYDDQEYAEARDAFDGLRDLGLVQPWVAPFNAGAAAYREGRWDDAVDAFEEALDRVPDDRACDVRVNLALTHEAAGAEARRAGDRAGALTSFRDARAALGGSGCDETAENRLERKIRSINAAGPGAPDRQNSQLSEKEKIEKLERLNEEARKRRDEDPDPSEEPDVAIQW